MAILEVRITQDFNLKIDFLGFLSFKVVPQYTALNFDFENFYTILFDFGCRLQEKLKKLPEKIPSDRKSVV